MKEKWNLWLPVALMIVFAASRFPGLMPPNFSAAYGLVFCAGVYFPRRLAWWLPLTTMAVTDLGINLYYSLHSGLDAFQWYQCLNYAVYAAMIVLGKQFSARSPWWKLVGGGILGAVLFYLWTNTASWWFNPFQNPEYTKTLPGWLIALTKGTAGYPETWEFFRNTLISGGLFTGLFAGAMKMSERSAAVETAEAAAETDEAKEEAPTPG